jgi:hypothetical protein
MCNDFRMAVESIAGNTNTLDTALTAAVQYKSALMTGGGGGQKQGGAQRYGQVAAMQVTGDENAAAQASSPAAGMQEMKTELAAITSALAAIGAKKGGKGKPPGGAPPRGPRKQTGSTQVGQAQDARQAMRWAHSMQGIGSSATIVANGGSTLRHNAQGRKQSVINSHPGRNCRHPVRRGTLCLTQTKQRASHEHDSHRQRAQQQERTISARKGEKM